ncbi:conserved hypothetical protein [Ricinus communis]|uniref:Uncharacterized protein n=1 Tax=Ricinus communis TaxID=3988 RepID=B9SER3_RICCO|nr:conserved hypothetical protein [Ricinus communis]
MGKTEEKYREGYMVTGSTSSKQRTMRKAAEEQKPVWIRVREMGNGQLYIFLSRMNIHMAM